MDLLPPGGRCVVLSNSLGERWALVPNFPLQRVSAPGLAFCDDVRPSDHGPHLSLWRRHFRTCYYTYKVHSSGLYLEPASRPAQPKPRASLRSVRRALVTPQVNPGSPYRCCRSA